MDKISLPDLVSIGSAPGKLRGLSSDRTYTTKTTNYDIQNSKYGPVLKGSNSSNNLNGQTSFEDLDNEA